jgi:hypothetical protein
MIYSGQRTWRENNSHVAADYEDLSAARFWHMHYATFRRNFEDSGVNLCKGISLNGEWKAKINFIF